MKVQFNLDTEIPGDINILAAFQRAVSYVPAEGQPEVQPGQKPTDPKPVPDPLPEPPAEKPKGKKSAKKKSAKKKPAEKDPDFKSMSFDELCDYITDATKPTVSHARFMAKAYLNGADDKKAAKKLVIGKLKASGSPSGKFEDLDDSKKVKAFAANLSSAVGGSNDDDDLDI